MLGQKMVRLQAIKMTSNELLDTRITHIAASHTFLGHQTDGSFGVKNRFLDLKRAKSIPHRAQNSTHRKTRLSLQSSSPAALHVAFLGPSPCLSTGRRTAPRRLWSTAAPRPLGSLGGRWRGSLMGLVPPTTQLYRCLILVIKSK